MMNKSWLVAVLCLAGAGSVFADDAKDELTPQLKSEIKAAITRLEKDCPDENEIFDGMKKAGASYLSELTADHKKVDAYLGVESRRLMVGVYLMDMNYAVIFGKTQAGANFAGASEALMGKLGFRNQKIIAQYRKAINELKSPAAKQAFRDLNTMVEEYFAEMVNSPEGVEFAVDAFYGWAIEGLYLTCELISQSDYNPALVRYLNDQKATVDALCNVLVTFKHAPNLKKLVDSDDRLALLSQISKILSKSRTLGKDEVEAIRVVVTPERLKIIR